VLHVAPVLWHAGGHSRTLLNWVKTDTTSIHSIALTQHTLDASLSDEVRSAITQSGGELHQLPRDVTYVDRALRLRAIAANANVVILHHTCLDVTPIVAFAVGDLPPVGIVNDCDQAYWLGTTIADVIINQREAGARVSRQRRPSRANVILPIPLRPVTKLLSQSEARSLLGIPPSQLMMLSVGRGMKYRPSSTHDFFATTHHLLERVPGAHLHIVGLSDAEAQQWMLSWQHPRVHLHGSLPDPSLHRAAADLYLESMPFGSATALLEAAQVGLPVMLPFSPPHDLFVTNHGIETIVHNPATEEAYLNEAAALLASSDLRRALGQRLRTHVELHHTGDGWRRNALETYRHLESCRHTPIEIPTSTCIGDELDVALCEWQAFLKSDIAARQHDRPSARAIALDELWHAQQRADFRSAWTLIRRFIQHCGPDLRILRSMAGLARRHLITQLSSSHVRQSFDAHKASRE
jgi:hypothetical protein